MSAHESDWVDVKAGLDRILSRQLDPAESNRRLLSAYPRQLIYALITGDGLLSFVHGSEGELRLTLTERGGGGFEYGRDLMTEPQDLFVFFAVSEVDPQLRPLNLVMNSLVKEFDPENGWGRYRGTVALVQRNGDEWFGSLDQEHRELIETKWRVALDATRAWQAQRNAETRGEGA